MYTTLKPVIPDDKKMNNDQDKFRQIPVSLPNRIAFSSEKSGNSSRIIRPKPSAGTKTTYRRIAKKCVPSEVSINHADVRTCYESSDELVGRQEYSSSLSEKSEITKVAMQVIEENARKILSELQFEKQNEEVFLNEQSKRKFNSDAKKIVQFQSCGNETAVVSTKHHSVVSLSLRCHALLAL